VELLSVFNFSYAMSDTSTSAEAYLCRNDDLISFQVQHESIIGNTFQYLANKTGKGKRTIICGVCCTCQNQEQYIHTGTIYNWHQLEGQLLDTTQSAMQELTGSHNEVSG